MFDKLCKHMINELQQYKNKDKNELFFNSVSTRLNKSFMTYEEELTLSEEYLERRQELRVMKRMNKL